VNAASFIPGPVAPGSLIAIFGTNLSGSTASATSFPLPTSLGNTSIRLNGVLIPLLYVSPTQVNAQVPFEIAPGAMGVVATSNDLTSLPVRVEISGTGPGIFLLEGTHAAATNLDGSVNSSVNPIRAGSYLTVYFTGQGAFNNPYDTGAPAPMSPLSWTVADTTATIGGTDTVVSFSGATPTLAGLSQVNLVVPADLAPGDYPVAITVGGVTSNSGTISVTP
jgi:adhesin/invasin